MKINKILTLALLVLTSAPAYALPPAQLLNLAIQGTVPASCKYYINSSTLKSGPNSIPYTIQVENGAATSIPPSVAIFTRAAGLPNQ